jgi:hypothetical protein
MVTGDIDPILPTDLPEWDKLNRLAFEGGHTGAFISLGTWVLARTRQLKGADVSGGIDGALVPGYPIHKEHASDDDFYEAVGMERLYTAVVNMEARPAYLSHLFHALGKSCASTPIGTSHPGMKPLLELPSVTREYVCRPRGSQHWLICCADWQQRGPVGQGRRSQSACRASLSQVHQPTQGHLPLSLSSLIFPASMSTWRKRMPCLLMMGAHHTPCLSRLA